jgi:hypothetical protein
MPLELARFQVEDWCDPTEQPPEWWRWQEAHAGALHREPETAEWHWYLHARLAHMRAMRAWKAEHAGSP